MAMGAPCPGGPMCVPRVRQYGYYSTKWRQWPGEQRPAISFPRSIGREPVPTPPGQPRPEMPVERVPERELPADEGYGQPGGFMPPQGQGFPGGGLPGAAPGGGLPGAGLPGLGMPGMGGGGGLPGTGLPGLGGPGGGLPGLPQEPAAPGTGAGAGGGGDAGGLPPDLGPGPDGAGANPFVPEEEPAEQPLEMPAEEPLDVPEGDPFGPADDQPGQPGTATDSGPTDQPSPGDTDDTDDGAGQPDTDFETPIPAPPERSSHNRANRNRRAAFANGRDTAAGPPSPRLSHERNEAPRREPFARGKSPRGTLPEEAARPRAGQRAEVGNPAAPTPADLGSAPNRSTGSSWIDRLNSGFTGPTLSGSVGAKKPSGAEPRLDRSVSRAAERLSRLAAARAAEQEARRQTTPPSRAGIARLGETHPEHDGGQAVVSATEQRSEARADYENPWEDLGATPQPREDDVAPTPPTLARTEPGRELASGDAVPTAMVAPLPPTDGPMEVPAEQLAPQPPGMVNYPETVACDQAVWFEERTVGNGPDRVIPTTAVGEIKESRIGLDGFCPVALCMEEQWVPGRPDIAAEYGGHLYHFTGQASMEKFMDNPKAYAPQHGGLDPVELVDHGIERKGSVRHCVTYEGRLYLFASEENLRRFDQSPRRYRAE